MARDTVTVPREVLANAVSELKSLLAMCEGEVPSLLEDHFSYPKIVDAIEAGETALSSSDPEGGARGERDGGNDVRWAVNYLLEQIAAKFEAWDTMDLWRSDAASLVRSFKHDLTRTPSAGHDAGNLRGLAAPNHQPHAVSQGWRTDLENAPRDGTWFLTVNADEGADSFEVGKYDPYMTANFVEVGDNLFRKELRPSYDWTGFNNFHRATHWMPLPSPPSKEGE